MERYAALFALLILALEPGCDLEELQPVVPFEAFEGSQRGMTLSLDHSAVWGIRHDGQASRVAAFDSSTGEKLVEVGGGWAGSWQVADIAAAREPGHEGEAWLLFNNGYRVRVGPTGSFTEVKWPVPASFPASTRSYRGFTVGPDGAHFVITSDDLGFSKFRYLYRQDPVTLGWTRTLVPGASAIDYDEALDQVAVAWFDDSVSTISCFDRSTLAVVWTAAMEGAIQWNDFAVFGHHTAWANAGSIELHDESGQVTDEANYLVGPNVKALDFALSPENRLQLWWAGMFPHPSVAPATHGMGWYEVIESESQADPRSGS